MSVHIYITALGVELYHVFDNVLDILNEADRKRAASFYQAIDKYRFLAGRWLLHKWLEEKRSYLFIGNLVLDTYKRPVLPGVSFSISHSGNWAVLAVSDSNENIGLDIEEVKPLEVKDYLLSFTPAEQQYILEQDTLNRFYKLWTRKEAALKAIGQGFLLEPTLVSVLEDAIIFSETKLYVRELEIATGYTAHIATGSPDIEVVSTIKN